MVTVSPPQHGDAENTKEVNPNTQSPPFVTGGWGDFSYPTITYIVFPKQPHHGDAEDTKEVSPSPPFVKGGWGGSAIPQ